MSRVRFTNVGFSHPDAPPVLRSVSFDLGPGHYAVAGPNGGGKTTLLRLVAGELAPTSGTVALAPERPVIAFVRQAPSEPPENVVRFAWEWDGAACRIRARLGVDPLSVERWPTLSPGERQRFQLAAALHREPDLLLLDEPTNHVDREARAALAEALASYAGLALVVSHDRAFLDAVAAKLLWVDGGSVGLHRGTYGEVRARMREDAASRAHERRIRVRDARRLARERAAREQRRAAADRSISARTRIKSAKDSDARSALAKGRAEKGAAAQAARVAGLARRAERAAATAEAVRIEKDRGAALSLGFEGAPKRRLLAASLPAVRRGERTLVAPQPFTLDADDRLALVGPNGIGKSTFLEAVVAAWTLPPEHFFHLPQETPRGERRAAVARARELDADTRGRLMSLLSALGVDPVRLLESDDPSPGEARKLLLADALVGTAACLLLDEPTNHLDAPSIERLEAALIEYPGALLLVSHDEALLRATTRARVTLEEGRLARVEPGA